MLTHSFRYNSIRIRKKARHQELLDNEQKYQELQKVQDLCKQRSECVHCFLSIRESMLRSSLDKLESLQPENWPPPQASSDEASSKKTSQERGLVTPQRVKFVKFAMATHSFMSSASSGDQDAAATESLKNVVDFDAGFEFSSVGGTLAPRVSRGMSLCWKAWRRSILTFWRHFLLVQQGNDGSTSTVAMRNFDKDLATRVQELVGKSFVKKLSYNVAKEGIAVNENGTGFAQVSVTTQDRPGQRDLLLVTAILKLEFVADSTKLQSVLWHTVEERFDQAANGGEDSDCPSSSSVESLGCQTSFPSVVSLDQGGDAAAAAE